MDNIVQHEHTRMVKVGILKGEDANQVEAEEKQPITSTWTVKKKSDESYRT